MDEEIKEEALEQVKKEILFGFNNKDEIFDGVIDMFYDVEDFDEEWLKQTIDELYNQHQKESLTWKRPTGFDKLAKAFDELTDNIIVALHKAGYTRSDAECDCMEVIRIIDESQEFVPVGYCYYHTQDLERAVDSELGYLYIGFGCTESSDELWLNYGNTIAEILQKNDLEIEWNGTIDQRIKIININWQKVPDNEDWGMQRVIERMTSN